MGGATQRINCNGFLHFISVLWLSFSLKVSVVKMVCCWFANSQVERDLKCRCDEAYIKGIVWIISCGVV